MPGSSDHLVAPSPWQPYLAVYRTPHFTIQHLDDSRVLVHHDLSSTTSSSSPPPFKLLRWCSAVPTSSSQASAAARPAARLLLASQSSIHIFDAADPSFHARIDRAIPPTGYLDTATLISPDSILCTPDIRSSHATLWDIPSASATALQEVKPVAVGLGYAVRRSTGHLAMLTRPAAKDLVMVLGPDHPRQLETTIALDTTDAQGIRWSDDVGPWLAVWDASSSGTRVHVYTADGNRFLTYAPETESSEPTLGVERMEWCGGRLCIGGVDGRITILAGPRLKVSAVVSIAPIIEEKPASTLVFQEQQPSSGSAAPTYIPAKLPAVPPPAIDATKLGITRPITHLVPSPSGDYLAVVSAATPTTVWILHFADDSLGPHISTILVHHDSIRSLSWHQQRPNWLLLQCQRSHRAPHPQTSQTNGASHQPRSESQPLYTVYVWSPSSSIGPEALSTALPPEASAEPAPRRPGTSSLIAAKAQPASLPMAVASWIGDREDMKSYDSTRSDGANSEATAPRILLHVGSVCAILQPSLPTTPATKPKDEALGVEKHARPPDVTETQHLSLLPDGLGAQEIEVDDTFAFRRQ